ncbi:MAG TPA: LysE family transporter [Stellaceae bacterium]|jgi:threonine/homoserine/homoserine lactone efflux protein
MLFLTLAKGIVVGIVIALPVGPVGVLCVRRCLFEGARYGLASGIGAATADASLGAIAGFGLTFVRDWLFDYQDWFGLAGGVFLLGFGLKALFIGHAREPEPLGGERLLGAYASTFALTIANPITLVSFAVIFAKVGAEAAAGFGDVSLLVLGVFLGSLLWWLGLSFGIASVRHMAGKIVMLWLNRVSGAILLSSGGGLLLIALRGLRLVG